MKTIEDQARELLSPVLAECVRQRTAVGVAKYGQRLDENDQTQREKAIHLLQELMDGVQYALWAGWPYYADQLATLANEIHGSFDPPPSAAEIMAGGKR